MKKRLMNITIALAASVMLYTGSVQAADAKLPETTSAQSVSTPSTSAAPQQSLNAVEANRQLSWINFQALQNVGIIPMNEVAAATTAPVQPK